MTPKCSLARVQCDSAVSMAKKIINILAGTPESCLETKVGGKKPVILSIPSEYICPYSFDLTALLFLDLTIRKFLQVVFSLEL